MPTYANTGVSDEEIVEAMHELNDLVLTALESAPEQEQPERFGVLNSIRLQLEPPVKAVELLSAFPEAKSERLDA